MTNKYRGLEPIPVPENLGSERPVQMGLDGGFRGDVPARLVPPNSAVDILDIRYERGGIRKDFGWTPIGAPAAATILGLIEHKFIDALLQFHRLVRIYRNGPGNAVIEVWDGANWVLTDTSSEILANVYLSLLSALSCVYIADGTQVLEWCEVLEKFPQEDDFTAGNALDAEGESVNATIDPAVAGVAEYSINYDVIFFSSDDQDTDIILEFLHGAVVIGERAYHAGQFDVFPLEFENEAFEFEREIALNDTLTIRVKEVDGGSVVEENDPMATPGVSGAGEPDLFGSKTPDTIPAVSDRYTYHHSWDLVVLPLQVLTFTVEYFYNNGAGWIKAGESVYVFGPGNHSFTDEATFEIPNLTAPISAAFGIQGRRNPASGTGGNFNGTPFVTWDRGAADFRVHGHNIAVDLDDTAGVTYETTGGPISQFEKIDPGPGGRFVVFFARRLVVLRNYGDSQILSFSRDGILNDFTGIGSGELALVEARGDAVNDLMGAAVLDSNFLAIFRRTTIERCFETGNPDLALGVVGWQEGIGTTTPFSIKNVRGGAIFLGSDLMVYYLTIQGYTAIGGPIQQELIETLQVSGLDRVDTLYDHVLGEYWLGIPENGAAQITKAWIFSVNKFLDEQRIVWRARAMNVTRFALASEVE
ncbi:MAG: hypothetical protein AB7V18_19190 [Pyrinomonadaceae bacterium]